MIVVVGHGADAIATSSRERTVRRASSSTHDYEHGQLSSLLAGLRRVDRPAVERDSLTLVDVPLVSSSTVRAVVDGYRATRAPIVRPTSGDATDIRC